MILFINSAFGVGKTTVARLLTRRIRSAVLFDPEWLGWMLRRAPRAALRADRRPRQR